MEIVLGLGQFIIAHAPVLAGIVLPPIVDFIGKDVHSSEERVILTLLVCLTVAVALHWNQLILGSVTDTAQSFGIIFTESQVIFKLYFKNSTIRTALLDKMSIPSTSPDVQVAN